MATKLTRHPAKFTNRFMPVFAELLKGYPAALDPMAGTCKLAQIWDHGYEGRIYCNELEPEWALQADERVWLTIGDARQMPYASGSIPAICTSPTYATRMADHHEAKDASRRNTYTHSLGRPLTKGNTGNMNWGDTYRATHQLIWQECHRVLADGGLFILNISDHIRKGKIIPVTDWHIETLLEYEFVLVEHRKVETPRLRHGANSALRVPFESIVVMRKAG